MTNNNKLNTCILGQGITCGLNVWVNPDCSIEVSPGNAIFTSGEMAQFKKAQFFQYYLTSPHQKRIETKFGITTFFELTSDVFNPTLMDSLKQQHPEDFPNQDFLVDKVIAICLLEEENIKQPIYLLVAKEDLVKLKNIQPANLANKPKGIFSKRQKQRKLKEEEIEVGLRPVLKLPKLTFPRFGYHKLALEKIALGLVEKNIVNPFSKIENFKAVFLEYKGIIDEYIYLIQDALTILHDNFGSFLSNKESSYLKKFESVLIAKWKRFCEDGKHLYYIQYFYDWLSDLIFAYNELVRKLDGFNTSCVCLNSTDKNALLLLGSVLGGSTSCKPLSFRDTFAEPTKAETIQEIRCLHWRLMMMIWTFDLPDLGLEQVLTEFGFDPGVEEALDSTNYWEVIGGKQKKTDVFNFEKLPIKATPTQLPNMPLGEQAIPYYYPLDRNSIYSLHRFWDSTKTRLNQIDCHLSYNAHFADPEKPSTNVANDSYTNQKQIIRPLAFNLRPYNYFRLEGHIGKEISLDGDRFTINEFDLFSYLQKYHIAIEIVLIRLGDLPDLEVDLLGLGRVTSIAQGETLVLIYTDTAEQIDLEECNSDPMPEITPNIIIGDFWLPIKYSCCKTNSKVKKLTSALTTNAPQQ